MLVKCQNCGKELLTEADTFVFQHRHDGDYYSCGCAEGLNRHGGKPAIIRLNKKYALKRAKWWLNLQIKYVNITTGDVYVLAEHGAFWVPFSDLIPMEEYKKEGGGSNDYLLS